MKLQLQRLSEQIDQDKFIQVVERLVNDFNKQPEPNNVSNQDRKQLIDMAYRPFQKQISRSMFLHFVKSENERTARIQPIEDFDNMTPFEEFRYIIKHYFTTQENAADCLSKALGLKIKQSTLSQYSSTRKTLNEVSSAQLLMLYVLKYEALVKVLEKEPHKTTQKLSPHEKLKFLLENHFPTRIAAAKAIESEVGYGLSFPPNRFSMLLKQESVTSTLQMVIYILESVVVSQGCKKIYAA